MTDEEFTKFNHRLLVAFPNIAAWMVANSPDPAATQEVWRDTLRHCRLDECLFIVAEWIDGKRQPPTYGELHSTALIIRARVMFDRDKDRKREASQRDLSTYVDHKRAAQQQRLNYEPLPAAPGMRGMLDAYRDGLKIKAAYLEGSIDKADFLNRLDDLTEHVA